MCWEGANENATNLVGDEVGGVEFRLTLDGCEELPTGDACIEEEP